MKKVIALFCTFFILCGCAQDERLQCIHCGEWMSDGLMMSNEGPICVECFTDRGYLICRNCGDIYDPKYCCAPDFGCCDNCADVIVGFCWNCDDAYLIEQMGTADDGEHYICARCEEQDLIEIINNPTLVKFAEDYVDAYDEAYSEGFDEGYDSGYEDGYEEGRKDEYDIGYNS